MSEKEERRSSPEAVLLGEGVRIELLRIDVPGSAFLAGETPVGRRAGKAIAVAVLGGAVGGVGFVPGQRLRRARLWYRT